MHPLELQAPEIEDRGVYVIKNVTSMPRYGEAYISKNLVIAVNHQGVAEVEYDMKPAVFTCHDVSVIHPNHALMCKSTSPDYNATLLVISGRRFDELNSRLASYGRSVYHSSPAFHVEDSEYEMVCRTIDVIESVTLSDLSSKSSILIKAIEMLSQMFNDMRGCVDTKKVNGTTIFNRFYQLLAEHYKESREVCFYAEKLCLSPKYFGTLIRKEVGVTANRCIANYVVLQAKDLLATRRDLTIQQVSSMMGFPDQATFSRYFKTEVGLSPVQYRVTR